MTNTEHQHVEFDCYFEDGIMYNDFGNDVQIQHYIKEGVTGVVVNGEVKTKYNNISIERLMKLQAEIYYTYCV